MCVCVCVRPDQWSIIRHRGTAQRSLCAKKTVAKERNIRVRKSLLQYKTDHGHLVTRSETRKLRIAKERISYAGLEVCNEEVVCFLGDRNLVSKYYLDQLRHL